MGAGLHLITGLIMALIGAVAFACAGSFVMLLLARAIQGVGVGITSGAATAALVELHPTADRQRAALAATIATVTGSAAGPLFSDVLAEYARWPEQLPFVLFGIAILPVLLGIVRSEHLDAVFVLKAPVVTVGSQATRTLASKHQGPFLLACATAFTAFVVQAVFLSLGPSYLAALLDDHRPLIGGGVAFFLLGTSARLRSCYDGSHRERQCPLGCCSWELDYPLGGAPPNGYSAPYIFLRSRRGVLVLGCLWINKIAFPSADSTAHNI
jgi:MFS family permease